MPQYDCYCTEISALDFQLESEFNECVVSFATVDKERKVIVI